VGLNNDLSESNTSRFRQVRCNYELGFSLEDDDTQRLPHYGPRCHMFSGVPSIATFIGPPDSNRGGLRPRLGWNISPPKTALGCVGIRYRAGLLKNWRLR